MRTKMYILYDGRAQSGDTSRAWILDTAETEDEARDVVQSYNYGDAVWYEYDVQGKNLLNEKIRLDLSA